MTLSSYVPGVFNCSHSLHLGQRHIICKLFLGWHPPKNFGGYPLAFWDPDQRSRSRLVPQCWVWMPKCSSLNYYLVGRLPNRAQWVHGELLSLSILTGGCIFLFEYLKTLGAVHNCQHFPLIRPCLIKGGGGSQKHWSYHNLVGLNF